MKIAERKLEIAMKALRYISSDDTTAGNIAFRAIDRIEKYGRSNPHMGAPGGDRRLLPECPVCDLPMWVGNTEYHCAKCRTLVNKAAWVAKLERDRPKDVLPDGTEVHKSAT